MLLALKHCSLKHNSVGLAMSSGWMPPACHDKSSVENSWGVQGEKGRPKKRYKDCIKEILKQCSLPPRDLETCAQDRPGWRATIKSACSKFEDNRRDKISDARARRKASVTTPDEATFQCPYCPRLCSSRIGLYSHSRTHRMNSTEMTSSNTMVYQWWWHAHTVSVWVFVLFF